MYGAIEHSYCEPVAERLACDTSFASFFLDRAGVGGWSASFRCLKHEQTQARRSKYWWKNVYCPEGHCRCEGMRGRELDILAVFERDDGQRLGLHIECKNPQDRFHENQAKHYADRIACWVQQERWPRTVLPHQLARSLLICDRANRHDWSSLSHFNGIIFFDEIAAWIFPYPQATM